MYYTASKISYGLKHLHIYGTYKFVFIKIQIQSEENDKCILQMTEKSLCRTLSRLGSSFHTP